jgi:hypothetical protein
MEGARGAYPFVMKLMLAMDPEHTPRNRSAGEESGGIQPDGTLPNIRREATTQLAEVLSPGLFDVITGTMSHFATNQQAWKLLELNVTKSWIHGISIKK